jgi:hypothetical protein
MYESWGLTVDRNEFNSFAAWLFTCFRTNVLRSYNTCHRSACVEGSAVTTVAVNHLHFFKQN